MSNSEMDVDEAADNGENLMENQANDYRPIAALDQYDQRQLDDTEYENQGIAQRRAAEAELDERDVRNEPVGRRQGGWAPAALMQEDEAVVSLRQRQRMEAAAGGFEEQDYGRINLEDYDGPLELWIEQPRVEREIKHRFRQFLVEYVDENQASVYIPAINKMCRENKCSLEVSYLHLSQVYPSLAIWTADAPAMMLKYFDEEAMRVVLNEFPQYKEIASAVHVRMAMLPLLDGLRDLRKDHLNQLIKTSGVVTRRTNVFPQLKQVNFDCVACGYLIGPFMQTGDKEVYPASACPSCQSKGPFKMNSNKTIFQNYQKVTIQETPGTVPAGRIPRSREIIMTNDLCDNVRPGEEIHVTGIYQNVYDPYLNMQNGFPVFQTVIVANYISKKGDLFDKYAITDDDKIKIREMAKKQNIEEMIINSIAPSIFGHDFIKQAIAYCLFGGMEKNSRNKHRVRGDINVLLMGDPGCGKSQFLKWTEKVAFRAVYATGKGASAVGLTASVRKDPLTREWTLEGGALVLADRGVCMIDEFDKMNEQDRTSIHEAMEQQTISISKAGIVTTLQARCAVIAAANPIKGRYDPSMSFIENVDLTDPILSRFDILWVVRDEVDPVKDEMLADFVVGNHIRNHPNVERYQEVELAARQGQADEGVSWNMGKDFPVDADGNPKQGPLQPPLEVTYWWGQGDVVDQQVRQAVEIKRVNRTDLDGQPTEVDVVVVENPIFKEKKKSSAEQIDQDLLRKYILYAKKTIKPKLHQVDKEKIANFYAELRQKSMEGGGIPIAVRHIESILRVAEARAKMHLRDFVRDDDVDMAIRMVLKSFIRSQKLSVRTNLERQFRSYLNFSKHSYTLLLHKLDQMVNDETWYRGSQDAYEQISLSMADFKGKAAELNVHDLSDFLKSDRFKEAGFSFDGKETIVKSFA